MRVRIESILDAGHGRGRGVRRGGEGLRGVERDRRRHFPRIGDALRSHEPRDELDTLLDLLLHVGRTADRVIANALEHDLGLRQAIGNLSGSDHGHGVHGGRLNKRRRGGDAMTTQDLPVSRSRGDVAGAYTHGKQRHGGGGNLGDAGNVGKRSGGGVPVAIVGSVNGNCAHGGCPRLILERLSPVERILEDASIDRALDEARRDDGILDVDSANAVFLHNLLVELHRTVHLVRDDVRIDDRGIHLGIQTIVKGRFTIIISDGQAAVLAIALDCADEIARVGESSYHGREGGSKRGSKVGLHVLEELEHIGNPARLGACRDELMVRLGRVGGSLRCHRRLEKLEREVQAIILGEDGMLELMGIEHKLPRLLHAAETHALLLEGLLHGRNLEGPRRKKTDEDVECIAVGQDLAPKHVCVHIQGLGDDLNLLGGKMDGCHQEGIVRSGDGADADAEHGLEHSGDLGIPAGFRQLSEMVGVALRLGVDRRRRRPRDADGGAKTRDRGSGARSKLVGRAWRGSEAACGLFRQRFEAAGLDLPL